MLLKLAGQKARDMDGPPYQWPDDATESASEPPGATASLVHCAPPAATCDAVVAWPCSITRFRCCRANNDPRHERIFAAVACSRVSSRRVTIGASRAITVTAIMRAVPIAEKHITPHIESHLVCVTLPSLAPRRRGLLVLILKSTSSSLDASLRRIVAGRRERSGARATRAQSALLSRALDFSSPQSQSRCRTLDVQYVFSVFSCE